MANIVLTNNVVDPTILQPLVISELNWIQSSISAITTTLANGIIGCLANSGNGVIIDGQYASNTVIPISGTVAQYIPSTILDRSTNEIYYFGGNPAFDYSSGAYLAVDTSFPNPADPVQFSDGNNYYTMQSRQLVLQSSPTGALFPYSTLTGLYGNWVTVGTGSAPPFQGGWANLSSLYQSCRFKIDAAGEVSLDGTVTNLSSGGTVFTLPTIYCPAFIKIQPIWNNAGPSATFVEIVPNGDVILSDPGTYDLSCVKFFIN